MHLAKLAFGLIALYALAWAAPMVAACLAVGLYAFRWKQFQSEDSWWQMKAGLLVSTMAAAGAVSLSPKYGYPIINALLVANIAVTVRYPLSDFEAHVHALAAGLIAYLLVYGWQSTDGAGPIPSALPWWWIFLYTVWNFSFVYIRFPESIWRAALVLALPLEIALWRGPTAWLYARGSMLALGLTVGIAFKKQVAGEVRE